ncbi:MAG: hypothetical protein FD175_855 [Beijerinckiaceae bacterium]|nr:MAG: hypothetical protein FD175_855 [Beijerinckiaceae bacterium]
MTLTNKTLSRRTLVAGVTLAAVPALAAAPVATGTTPIARLWTEAQTLAADLATHRGAIAAAASNGGIPGWMRLGGEANRIAEARYAKLVAILNTPAKTAGDLAILGKVSQDDDILNGARAWASERLASATVALAA